jgi:hypothetical protein
MTWLVLRAARVAEAVDAGDLKPDSTVHELPKNSFFSRSFEWR